MDNPNEVKALELARLKFFDKPSESLHYVAKAVHNETGVPLDLGKLGTLRNEVRTAINTAQTKAVEKVSSPPTVFLRRPGRNSEPIRPKNVAVPPLQLAPPQSAVPVDGEPLKPPANDLVTETISYEEKVRAAEDFFLSKPTATLEDCREVLRSRFNEVLNTDKLREIRDTVIELTKPAVPLPTVLKYSPPKSLHELAQACREAGVRRLEIHDNGTFDVDLSCKL